MQELLASLGPQIEEAAGDVTRMMHMIEKVKQTKTNRVKSLNSGSVLNTGNHRVRTKASKWPNCV